MELNFFSFEGMTVGSIVAGLIQVAILAAAVAVARWARRVRFVGRAAFLASNKFAWRSLSSIIFCFASAELVSFLPRTFVGNVNVLLLATFGVALLALYYQWKFAAVGLHGAQLSVSRGTDYEAALNLCRNHFALLGTGAHKLSLAKNFEAALERCSDDATPVRFLLSHPDNKIIANAEKKAGVMSGSYRHNLVLSLQKLKKIHDEKGLRFEVRFYRGYSERDFENFRMMFIDGEILLLSYNVYGKGGGQDAAQLVLLKSKLDSATKSFFFAYENYFDRLWSTSELWDFQAYV